jgi:outer membrane protein assembly factor BamB
MLPLSLSACELAHSVLLDFLVYSDLEKPLLATLVRNDLVILFKWLHLRKEMSMPIRLPYALPLLALLALAGCGAQTAAPQQTGSATTSAAVPTATPTPPPTPSGPSGTPAPTGPVLFAGLQDGMLLALSPNDGTVYWHYTTGAGAPPALDAIDGVLYVAMTDGLLDALDDHTGVLLWSFQVGASFSDAVANGVVFIASSNGTLLALNASDGSIRWQQPLNETTPLTPVVANGVVYLGDDTGLHAYNATNGTLLWQNNIAGGVASNPLLSNGTIFVLGYDGNFYSFDASDGSPRWKVAYGIVATAGPNLAANKNLIYLDTPRGTSAIDTPGTLQALGASSGAIVWKKSGLAFGQLADSGGILYIDAVNTLLALKDGSGAADWTFQSVGSSNVLIANGLLYVGSNDGSIYSLNASDGSARWHAPLGGPVEVVALGS